MDTHLVEKMSQAKIIAIVRGVKEEDMLPVVEALLQGGLQFVEFTLDHTSTEMLPLAMRVVKSLRSHFADSAHIGVGTVLAADEAEAVIEAGAEYIVSPNTNLDVIRRTKQLNTISLPGAMTPSEIAAAYGAGADIVKLFPAGHLGTSYVKAVRGPLAHIPLMATGGITAENIRSFLSAGCVCAGVGGNLVSLKEIAEKNYAFITQEARKYISALSNPV